ncbi:MAG: DUF1015 domain-containing protein [Chitinispirillaceae bacterium]|nr:DUF1015 domain-containing protein [Chitinispirillaceae bacterium]
MLAIRPFRGYRFRCGRPEDLGRFISPPYDMLDDSMVAALHEKDPRNAVRIVQNRPEPSDTTNRERHARAARIWGEWVAQGIVVQDKEPSVYLYEQTFSVAIGGVERSFTRTAVVAMVALSDFGEKIVFPHEYTLSGPKADRYEQMEETRLNEGVIFGLLADDNGDLYRLILALKNGDPLGTAVDADGVRHDLYRCDEPSLIHAFTGAAKQSTILIADGHHRYETALSFYHNHHDEVALGFVMMSLVSMADPGLVIRSFHRLIRRRPQDRQVDFTGELRNYFTLTDYGAADIDAINTFLGTSGSHDEILFCDSASKRLYRLALNENGRGMIQKELPGYSPQWKLLNVSKINVSAVHRILGLPLDGHVLHEVIDYMNDAQAALRRCLSPQDYYGCFFIHPLTIGTIHAIVAGGERMPQKSTNFFPKFYSGLVFNRLGDA